MRNHRAAIKKYTETTSVYAPRDNHVNKNNTKSGNELCANITHFSTSFDHCPGLFRQPVFNNPRRTRTLLKKLLKATNDLSITRHFSTGRHPPTGRRPKIPPLYEQSIDRPLTGKIALSP